MHWLGTWRAAPQLTEPGNMPPEPLAHCTLRQIACASLGGAELRVHFSNAYGEAPLELREARLALSRDRDALRAGSERALSFAGAPGAIIPAGGTLCSDPLAFELCAGDKLALTLGLGQVPVGVTGHPGSRTTSFMQRAIAASAPAMPEATPVEHWYFWTGIDVQSADANRALVTLGDSLTDGRGSTTDGNDRWPDVLSRRLRANAATAGVAVLNQGIGGNAVLSGGLGPNALARFERDVLEACGARWVLVLEGVNDIGGCDERSVAGRLIEGYARLIAAARARGLLIYGSPLLPMGGSHYFSEEREAARQTLNAWVRESGAFDAVVDLDAAVRDPEDPSRLAGAFDVGDHLHLSPAGYRRLAEAVDLTLFTR